MRFLDNYPSALVRPFDNCLKLTKLPDEKTHSKRCFAYHGIEQQPSSSKGAKKKESKRTSFIDRYDFCCRRSEREYYARRCPNKVALIVERFKNEKVLDDLERTLFIVPGAMTAGQLQNVIKKQLKNELHYMPLYLLVNGSFLPANSLTMAELEYKHSSTDGFVYVAYSSNEVGG
ncbi:unnamed protein product [Toxocara canis]|uniref:Autophagy-related protein n=1 Tax=Toxocara canis TaxID=6265 RepID=A0A183UQ87_TOXCA|nr:unnamed protein product [Toxocara canis]